MCGAADQHEVPLPCLQDKDQEQNCRYFVKFSSVQSILVQFIKVQFSLLHIDVFFVISFFYHNDILTINVSVSFLTSFFKSRDTSKLTLILLEAEISLK